MAQRIAVGADHAGFEYKEQAKKLLISLGYDVKDFGTSLPDSTDYPDFAHTVALSVASGESAFGILVCGTGIGMAIVANKHEGIRAANVESVEAAKMARAHNNANILTFGSRLISWDTAAAAIKMFLATPFEGGRHQRRVDKIHSLTNL